MAKRKQIKTLADITPDARNANKGTQRGAGLLENSLRQYGAGRSILVDKHGTVIAGNKTLEHAASIGLDKVRVVETTGDELVVVQRKDLDLSKNGQARELAYADNRIGQVSMDWDIETIAADMAAGVDLERFWTTDELDELLGELGNAGTPEDPPDAQIDKADELRKKWGTARGQVWEIGAHRLMCGDCTSEGDVGELMAGKLADMLLTDPPYGVSYTGKTKDALKIKNDDLDEGQLQGLISLAFDGAERACRQGAYWYATVAPGPLHLIFAEDWKRRGILRQILVWVKDSMVLGHSEYHYKHEPILFGWMDGERHKNPDRTRTSVWEVERPKVSREHPTTKPVKLWSIALGDGSVVGESVYDPFLGSGTTMVAAEQLGRVCYGMEIEPKYVAVALERMADMGLEPKLVEEHANG